MTTSSQSLTDSPRNLLPKVDQSCDYILEQVTFLRSYSIACFPLNYDRIPIASHTAFAPWHFSDLEWSCEVFVIAELLGTIANWASIRANQIFLRR
jgi:hypothetical protein